MAGTYANIHTNLVLREIGGAKRPVTAAENVVELLQLAAQQARPLVHLAHHTLDLLLAAEAALPRLAARAAALEKRGGFFFFMRVIFVRKFGRSLGLGEKARRPSVDTVARFAIYSNYVYE